jgi:hypothetical protein
MESQIMTDNATQVAERYYAAWTGGDVDKAAKYLTEDIEIIAPNGTFTGHSGYHDFMDGFVAMLTGVSGLSTFGDDTTALLWYDTDLTVVPTLTAAERVTLTGDKISRIEITFDQMPMAQAFGGKVPAHGSSHEQ